jgi:hypothetical protein
MESYRRNSSEARRFEEQRRMEDQRRAEEQRRADEMRRAEEQRHSNDGYHPSEAAHQPQSHSAAGHLPPMQQAPSAMQGLMHEAPGSQPPTKKEYPSGPEERRMEHPPAAHPPIVSEPERAARTMDVDENYDDSGEEDKKAVVGPSSAPSSGSATATELKNGTPTTASMNGN